MTKACPHKVFPVQNTVRALSTVPGGQACSMQTGISAYAAYAGKSRRHRSASGAC